MSRPMRLSPDEIVSAALAVADADGMDAVSMRRLAADLGVGTMSLYTHVPNKETLLLLMSDAIGAEMLLDEVPADWRAGLTAIARATRGIFLRHPWVATYMSQAQPQIGVNFLRHIEQSLQAIAPLGLDPRTATRVLSVVDDFAIGHTLREVSERRSRPARGAADGAGAPLVDDLKAAVTASGEFPRLAQALAAGVVPEHPDEDAAFAEALEWLLDGIEKRFADGRGIPA